MEESVSKSCGRAGKPLILQGFSKKNRVDFREKQGIIKVN